MLYTFIRRRRGRDSLTVAECSKWTGHNGTILSFDYAVLLLLLLLLRERQLLETHGQQQQYKEKSLCWKEVHGLKAIKVEKEEE
jgi:hypothetical protein